jgi:glycosyltransferase involved in cell wall biosynthesis
MTSRVIICRGNSLAPDPRVEKIARALVDGGYHPQLLGWDMNGEFPEREQVDGLTYNRLSVKADFGRGLVNFRHQIRWQIALLNWLRRNRDHFDVIHACDFDTVLPALVCKRLWGKVVIYDIFDFYADMLRATPNLVVKLIRSLDIKAINRVDALILADDSRFQQIKSAHPGMSEVIYNCPEDVRDRIQTWETSKPKTSHLHLTYVGNIQVERGLNVLLDVLQSHPDWTLDLAGFGGDVAQIQSRVENMLNVRWYSLVPYDEGLRLSNSADVLFATYDPGIPNNRYASPNKVFEAMMLSKPIIVARDTNMDHIIEEVECGIVVDYGQAEPLENALQRFENNPDLRINLGKNGRRAYETTYNWGNMESRLLDLYQEVLSK